jgi:hypothetical protein
MIVVSSREKTTSTAFGGGENEEQRHLAGYKVIAPIGIRAKVIRPPHETNQYHY